MIKIRLGENWKLIGDHLLFPNNGETLKINIKSSFFRYEVCETVTGDLIVLDSGLQIKSK